MALGRLETFHAATGKAGSIRDKHGEPRDNILWHGNPAWDKDAIDGITDGGQRRPYIDRWSEWHGQPQIIFNRQYRPRAGKVHLTYEEKKIAQEAWLHHNGGTRYAVISPHIKPTASPNKDWGLKNWEEVIVKFPIPVYQLSPERVDIIRGAQWWKTSTMRDAAAVIANASIVLTNEGGSHHLAASMGTRAVVIFGAFIPPTLTGYASHENMAVETEEGYCGRYAPCDHCKKAMVQITPDMVKERALHVLGAHNAG